MFEKQKVEIKESVDARKQPIADENAWALLKEAKEIAVGKGKKTLSFSPSQGNREEILGNCLGRTGNLRAPTIKLGTKIIVGFNEDMYSRYLGK